MPSKGRSHVFAVHRVAALGVAALFSVDSNAVGLNEPAPTPRFACPTKGNNCKSTAAEAGVPQDFPSMMFTVTLQQSCMQGAMRAGMQGHDPQATAVAISLCICYAHTVAATPGEWRAIVVAVVGKGSLDRHSPIGQQIHSQLTACLDQQPRQKGAGLSTNRSWM